MRATINLEFTQEELVKAAQDIGQKLILTTIRDAAKIFKKDPSFVSAIFQSVMSSVQAGVKAAQPEPPIEPEVAYEPPDAGQPFGKCIRFEATKQRDDTWGCHQCGGVNGAHRERCRRCGHVCCATDSDDASDPGPTVGTA